jgi:energy-coupling factor transporter transmembrane protein EcfT
MTCRCYRGGKGRTRLNVLKFSFKDFAALFVIVAFGAGIILINIYAPGYAM